MSELAALDALMLAILSAMTGAICALWYQVLRMMNRLETLIRDEADCRARLESIRESLEVKHAENKRALTRLINGGNSQ